MFAMMKQLSKDDAGEWSTSPPPPPTQTQSAPAPEASPAQIRADAECVFAVLDYDGDGQLTIAELSQHLGAAGYSSAAIDNLFETVDINNDGEISCDELCACFSRFATLRQEPGLGDFVLDFVDESNAIADELFDEIDGDGDGQITKVELQAHLKETAYSEAAVGAIFDAIDVNDDGELSREELRGGLARYGALRLALGVGKYYDYGGVSPMPTEYRYFW
jgi:Ca2+-binding EF-hand superfamily protein